VQTLVSRGSQQCPRVSIVVTVYNAERTIKQCLDSVMKLDYPKDRLDVVVIDDGSTDNSADIVKKYPVRLVQKPHGGYPSAMNNGIKVTNGDVIFIIDSDAYVEKDWLEKALKEFSDPKVGIVSGYVASAPTRSFWARVAGYDAEDRFDTLKTKYVNHVSTNCTAYKRELFESIGLFDEKLKRSCDEDFAHRAFKRGWKLVVLRDAKCFHEWRASFGSYFKQQFGEGRYAVAIIRKAPELLLGTKIQSPSLYIPIVFTSLLFLTPLYFLVDLAWVSLVLLAGLFLYHVPPCIRILRKHRDWAMTFFPMAISVRYVAWILGLARGVMEK